MSQRTITTDNLTDHEVSDSTHYHVLLTDTPSGKWTGDKYEIDLSADSHAALVAMLTDKTSEFHKYMRRYVSADFPAGKRTRSTSTSPRNPAANSSGNPDETKRAREFVKSGEFKAPDIKAWGRDNGLSEFVKDGPGVMPSALVVGFAKAHGMPETPAAAPESPAPAPAESPAS